jgi:hypothetical protein
MVQETYKKSKVNPLVDFMLVEAPTQYPCSESVVHNPKTKAKARKVLDLVRTIELRSVYSPVLLSLNEIQVVYIPCVTCVKMMMDSTVKSSSVSTQAG